MLFAKIKLAKPLIILMGGLGIAFPAEPVVAHQINIASFSSRLLHERECIGLPPYRHMAQSLLLRPTDAANIYPNQKGMPELGSETGRNTGYYGPLLRCRQVAREA